ncbi:hypothetical protein JCM10449v2_006915 [Rhodotorula kratochvilovae]
MSRKRGYTTKLMKDAVGKIGDAYPIFRAEGYRHAWPAWRRGFEAAYPKSHWDSLAPEQQQSVLSYIDNFVRIRIGRGPGKIESVAQLPAPHDLANLLTVCEVVRSIFCVRAASARQADEGGMCVQLPEPEEDVPQRSDHTLRTRSYEIPVAAELRTDGSVYLIALWNMWRNAVWPVIKGLFPTLQGRQQAIILRRVVQERQHLERMKDQGTPRDQILLHLTPPATFLAQCGIDPTLAPAPAVLPQDAAVLAAAPAASGPLPVQPAFVPGAAVPPLAPRVFHPVAGPDGMPVYLTVAPHQLHYAPPPNHPPPPGGQLRSLAKELRHISHRAAARYGTTRERWDAGESW